MSGGHAESLIKNIIGDIVRECAVRGHAVSETLVAFMVKAVVLDPRNGFNVDRILTKQDVQKLEEVSLLQCSIIFSPYNTSSCIKEKKTFLLMTISKFILMYL
uniref:Cilia- and flagella-associated protein 206 n=1 Tax=Labrus bergylta TaxID=56723 RepID=A0A3Q3MU14_9LABR